MAIGKPKFAVGKCAEGASGSVVDVDTDKCVGDFLAVGTDILDGCGAGEARNLGEGFDAGEAFIDGVFYDIIPVFAAHDLDFERVLPDISFPRRPLGALRLRAPREPFHVRHPL